MRHALQPAVLALLTGCGTASLPQALETYAPIEQRLTATEAQQQTILARLSTHDPLEIAWAAYLAGELGVGSASEALIANLGDLRVRDNVQDALARIGAHVPDALLGGETSATAIALQNPAEHRDRIFAAWRSARESEPDWGGYANALTFIHDHGFAKALLEDLTSTVTLNVVSPGLMQGFGGCSCGGSSWCTSGRIAAVYTALPPRPFWAINDTADAECVVLLSGPADVCLTRGESDREDSVYALALDTNQPLRVAIAAAGHADALDEPFSVTEIVASAEGDAEDAPIDDGDNDTATGAEEALDPEIANACVAGEPELEPDAVDIIDNEHNGRRLDYIATLTAHDATFDGDVGVHHTYRDAATYLALAADIRSSVQASYAALVNRVDEAHLLDEPPRDIPVAFDVWDARSCGVTSALPQIK